MADRSLASPENQGATFVELFFDLVFVFAVTQVAHHAAQHLDAWSLFNTSVVFWLVWWAWTQFTWALNAADTERHEIRLGTLISTGVAFVMAASIGQAFGDEALWFAGAYVLVRLLGLGLYHVVASNDPAQQRGVRTFAIASAAGLVMAIGGALAPPSIRPWIWLLVVALDLIAAVIAGRHQNWNLHAAHFAERHGLIVIIALGESLIVAGAGVQTADRTPALLLTGLLAVGATCLLWWTYFGWAKDAMEAALERVPRHGQEGMARDAYSFWHFPLVCGIVCFAVGLQGVVEGDGPVGAPVAAALGCGVALFVGATAASLWRTRGLLLWPRLLLVVVTAGWVWLAAPAQPAVLLGIVCAGLGMVIAVEHARCDPARALRPRSAPTDGEGDGA